MNFCLAQYAPFFLLGLLAWIVPYAAFVTSSIQWFNKRQALGGLFLTLALGCLSGAAFAYWRLSCAAPCSGLITGVLSEGLFAGLARKLLQKALVIGSVCLLFFCLEHFLGIWAPCLLLLGWLPFSLLDLRRNLRKPKKFQLHAPKPGLRPIEIDAKTDPASLSAKPNIYFLFLESMHSPRGLEALYDHDDFGLGQFLVKRGFTLFKNAHSNEFGTTYSLNTLLNMNAREYKPLERPPAAFQWLHANGYKINLIDCSSYTFSHYAGFADSFNYAMPGWVDFLFAWCMPFFLQSSFLKLLTRNIDPFTDVADFQKIFADFRALPSSDQPAFTLLRFGAEHTPAAYTLKQRPQFAQSYLQKYEKAAREVRVLINYILERDADSIIVAMGDHGANSYSGPWIGQKDVNAAMRAEGIEPALVAEDLTDILLAIRAPGPPLQAPDHMTPANVFRQIFHACGLSVEKLPLASPDYSFFHAPQVKYPFLLMRDGNILEDWLQLTPQASLAEMDQEKLRNGGASPEESLQLGNALLEAGKFEEALGIWLEAEEKFGFNGQTSVALAYLWLRMGKPDKTLELLQPHFSRDIKFLKPYLFALGAAGCHEKAREVFGACSPAMRTNPDTRAFIARTLAHLAGDFDSYERFHRELADREYPEAWRKDAAVSYYLMLLSCLDRDAQALAYARTFMEHARLPDALIPHTINAAQALALRLKNLQLAQVFAKRGAVLNRFCPATIRLWQAGVLEQLGEIEQAAGVLASASDAPDSSASLAEQAALLALRHNLPRSDQLSDLAAHCLREGEKLRCIFDEDFYAARYASSIAASGLAPFEHFLQYSRFLCLDPCPEFKAAYYILKNPEVFLEGHDPYQHFLRTSPFKNRYPSAIFNLNAYMGLRQDADWARKNPLVDHLQTRLAR